MKYIPAAALFSKVVSLEPGKMLKKDLAFPIFFLRIAHNLLELTFREAVIPVNIYVFKVKNEKHVD